MRNRGHLWLLVFLLLLVGIDGGGASAAHPEPESSGPRDADTTVLVAAPAALPACRWSPSDGSRGDLDSVPATLVAAASVAATPFPSGLRSREWLNFRRPFADTVSYRTTAPPSRFS